VIEIARLDTREAGFEPAFARLLAWTPESDAQVAEDVARIVADVATRGDDAVLEYTRRFDRREVTQASALEVSAAQRREAAESLPAELLNALNDAARRIRAYADHQRLQGFDYTDALGNRLGQQVTPMDRVGLYVPGGKAAYPSSVLMNAVPAKVAGVGEIIMTVPAPGGELNPVVLAAAQIGGVDRVFTVGGAQAVAALAYGTATIPAVDKIVGPGNAYVAAAKRQVFGRVGIDSIAGPSEIVVICDGETSADWIAMDLFSQAEHGEDSQSILLTPDAKFLDAVQAAMDRRIAELPRAELVRAALKNRSALILTRDLDEAVALSNRIAPEHLELSVAAPRQWLPKVRHAGAVFLGRLTPEAFGDYCAGPNHVLPTARTARFSNPLGVYEFQKRTTLIESSPQGAKELARIAGTLADAEGLQAHALSARDRAAGNS
jgi:histidinol dehydrogenase